MVYRSSTELSIEFLGSKVPEVLDSVRPKVQDIVPGEGVSFFNHHHLGTKQSQLYGSPKAAGTATNDETLLKQTSLALFNGLIWMTLLGIFWRVSTSGSKDSLQIRQLPDQSKPICACPFFWHNQMVWFHLPTCLFKPNPSKFKHKPGLGNVSTCLSQQSRDYDCSFWEKHDKCYGLLDLIWCTNSHIHKRLVQKWS